MKYNSVSIKRLALGLLIIGLSTSPLVATESVSKASEHLLTWEACLALARAKQPQLGLVAAKLKAAEAKLQDTYKTYFPTLSLDASFTESGTGTTASGGSNSLSASLAKDFFTTEQDEASVAAAKADYLKTKASVQSTLSDASYALSQAFIAMTYQQSNITLLEAIAARRKANLDLVELRFEGGREHKGSLLHSDAAYRQAVSDGIQAKRGLDVARRQLSAAIGINVAADATVGTDVWQYAPTIETPDIDALVDTLPDAISAHANLAAAEADVIVAKHTYRPTIAGSASLSKSGSSLSLDNPSWSAKLGLSLPTYIDPRDQLNQTQYQAAADEASFTLQQTLKTLAYQLQSAYVGMLNAHEAVDIQQGFVAAAQLRSEIGTHQYTTGLLSFDNWDVIENDLINQQKSLLSRQRDAQLADAAWQQIQGKGVL